MAADFKARMGRRIRAAREAAGLTQMQVAERLPGATHPTEVSRWERGVVQPNPETTDALAEVLNVQVETFYCDPPTVTEAPELQSVLAPSSLADIHKEMQVLREDVAQLLAVLKPSGHDQPQLGDAEAFERELEEAAQTSEQHAGNNEQTHRATRRRAQAH